MKKVSVFILLLSHFAFIPSLYSAERESKEESVALSAAVSPALTVPFGLSSDSLPLPAPRWRISTEEGAGVSLKVWGNNLFLKNYSEEEVPVVQIPLTNDCLKKLRLIRCLDIMDQAHNITGEGLEHFATLTTLSLYHALNFKGVTSSSLKKLSLSESILGSGSELLSPLTDLDVLGDQTFTADVLPSTLESFSALLCPSIKGNRLPASLTYLSVINCEGFTGESLSTLPFLSTLRVRDCPMFNIANFLSQGFSSTLTKVEWSNNIPKEDLPSALIKISESVKKVHPLLSITLSLREAEEYYVLTMEGKRRAIEELPFATPLSS